jgi:hypothetical protein
MRQWRVLRLREELRSPRKGKENRVMLLHERMEEARRAILDASEV